MSSPFDEEEWFFRSVRQYDELFMYDLQRPATSISWFEHDSVCLACNDEKTRNSEILQLHVPQKLLNPSQELCKDRDFQVLGGCFYPHHIDSMLPDPSSRSVWVSETDSNSLSRLQLPPPHTDDIIQVKERHRNIKPSQVSSCIGRSVSGDGEVDRLVFGSHGDGLCQLDNSTGHITQITQLTHGGLDERLCERLCGLYWSSESTLLVGGASTGQLLALDTNTQACTSHIQPGPHTQAWTSHSQPQQHSTWTMAVSPVNSAVYLMNSVGNLHIFDGQTNKHSLDVIGSPDGERGTPRIRCSPTKANLFSVSGLDGNVCIYDSTHADHTLTPIFKHEGHMTSVSRSKVKVTDHVWHPTIDQLMMSADNTGALHAWKYTIR